MLGMCQITAGMENAPRFYFLVALITTGIKTGPVDWGDKGNTDLSGLISERMAIATIEFLFNSRRG